jgi:ribonuclease P protein component
LIEVNTPFTPCLFRRKNRLLIPQQFSRVFQIGTKRRKRYWVLFFCENDTVFGRLGLAIAKRHFPHAVKRNRLKRMIRESFRQHQGLLAGWDIVVMTNGKIPIENQGVLRNELEMQWQMIAKFPKKLPYKV